MYASDMIAIDQPFMLFIWFLQIYEIYQTIIEYVGISYKAKEVPWNTTCFYKITPTVTV